MSLTAIAPSSYHFMSSPNQCNTATLGSTMLCQLNEVFVNLTDYMSAKEAGVYWRRGGDVTMEMNENEVDERGKKIFRFRTPHFNHDQ